MAVRPIDAMELKQRMCALCNQAHSDEPCEPSDCVFVRAINEAPTLTPPNEWLRRVKELDELYTKLQIVTGFTAEQLLEMFAAGYTLEKPDYSKHFEAMANLAESDPPNEPRAGLYGKYTVYKNKDGSLVTDCFILRPAKDPAAVAALRAYAATTDNAELAADIINWVGAEPNEWVSAEERLPENHAQVLMWSAKWNIEEAGSYYKRRFWVYSEIGDAYIADDITHWMLLPAPPDSRPPEGEEDT